MFEPLISVIVPVYNSKNYLACCIESIVKQSYPNIEIILVDDGSTDGSELLCDALTQKNDNIICIHQKNQGVSSARNIGIDVAKGEYIYFCDSDDVCFPAILDKLYRLIVEYEADMGVCSFFRDKSPQKWKEMTDRAKIDFWDNKKMVEHIISGENGYLWNKLFKRTILGSIRFDEDIAILEDELFVLRYLSKCSRVACTNEVLYGYRDNPASAVHARLSNKTLTSIIAKERIFNLINTGDFDIIVKKKAWNVLVKFYAVAMKKIVFSMDISLKHWIKYISNSYIKLQKEYGIDDSWNIKEKVYLMFLRAYTLLQRILL